MRPTLRRRTGITTIEFAACLALLAVFAAFLLNRLAAYEELAEKTTVDLTISQIRDGIRHDLIRALLAGKRPVVNEMLERNPVSWLAQPPEAHMGEFGSLPGQARPGAWYYVSKTHELVYVPRHSAHLNTPSSDPVRLRWRLLPAANGSGMDALEPVRIDAQPAYLWF